MIDTTDSDVRESDFPKWPLFNEFRSTQHFANAFARRFDKGFQVEVPTKDEIAGLDEDGGG